MKLSQAGKEALALALVLWKDFKDDGRMDIEVMKQVVEFSKYLGIEKEFQDMLTKLPPLKITSRY